jgi:DNA-binding GntR family transcriptional regulator
VPSARSSDPPSGNFACSGDGFFYNAIMEVDSIAADVASTAHGGAVSRAAADVRALILQRSLLPGEQVRQEDLARHIGTSRGPIREALQVLAVEGVLRYERNRGYFVTRFSADEMTQLYLIRDLLESEILTHLPAAEPETLARLRTINEDIRSGGDDLDRVIQLNHEFHDVIFAASHLDVLRAELEHIGRMTMAYQSLSINALTDWDLLYSDHEQIIDAWERGDSSELVAVSRRHRETSLKRIAPILR